MTDYFESSDDYSALSIEEEDFEHESRRKLKYVDFEPKADKIRFSLGMCLKSAK